MDLRNRTAREIKEEGKPCVTSVTIILLETTVSKFHFLLNRSFCKGPENIGVK